MRSRLIFFGTAEIACPSLKALREEADFEILAVVSQPDKARGRDMQVQPTAVKALALELGLPILQPRRARDESFIEQIRSAAPDLMVVIAYGQILPQSLLDIPRFGCLNVHTSLLPRHRGAAPIHWAILSGDEETGVTIMKMDAGLDTGPILNMEKTRIEMTDTAQTLHDRLAVMGAGLLVSTIRKYISGEIVPQPQPDGATYARKLEKTDGLIDWTEPASLIDRKIRAFTPWPGAWTNIVSSDGRKRMLKILKGTPEKESGAPGALLRASRDGLLIACGEGSLLVTELQPEARRRMPASEFLSGHPLAPGQVFTR